MSVLPLLTSAGNRRPRNLFLGLTPAIEQHPDKTFIGRISRGFDFLGYAFTPAALDAAPPTIERCAQRVSQLYEQGVDLIHIGNYVRRWLRWARSGLRALGAGLAERALVLVVRSLVRMGSLVGFQPMLLQPAVAGPSVGEDGDDGSDRRYNRG
jgi:RNA-directed DNA polymerase